VLGQRRLPLSGFCEKSQTASLSGLAFGAPSSPQRQTSSANACALNRPQRSTPTIDRKNRPQESTPEIATDVVAGGTPTTRREERHQHIWARISRVAFAHATPPGRTSPPSTGMRPRTRRTPAHICQPIAGAGFGFPQACSPLQLVVLARLSRVGPCAAKTGPPRPSAERPSGSQQS